MQHVLLSLSPCLDNETEFPNRVINRGHRRLCTLQNYPGYPIGRCAIYRAPTFYPWYFLKTHYRPALVHHPKGWIADHLKTLTNAYKSSKLTPEEHLFSLRNNEMGLATRTTKLFLDLGRREEGGAVGEDGSRHISSLWAI